MDDAMIFFLDRMETVPDGSVLFKQSDDPQRLRLWDRENNVITVGPNPLSYHPFEYANFLGQIHNIMNTRSGILPYL